MISENSSCNPPDIEQILGTIVTKDNKRYYKVKWVKITWEEETDLAYFSNVINQFWREYIPDILPLNTANMSSDTQDILANNNVQNERQQKAKSRESCSPILLSNSLVTAEGLCDFTDVADYDPPVIAKEVESVVFEKSGTDLKRNKITKLEMYKLDVQNKVSQKKTRLLKYDFEDIKKKCLICGKQCSRISHLKTHMLTHSSIRPWSCDQCNKSFADKSTLTKHKLVHSNIRRFQCELCKSSFQRREHLKRHTEAKHDKIKKFQCKICNKKFHQNSSLKVHLNIHTGDKPYSCTQCLRAFADNSTLVKHLSTHNKNKVFKCKHCDKSFTSRQILGRHIHSIHVSSN